MKFPEVFRCSTLQYNTTVSSANACNRHYWINEGSCHELISHLLSFQEPSGVIRQNVHNSKAKGLESLKHTVSTEYLRMMVETKTYGFIPWENDGPRRKDGKDKKANGTQPMELKTI